MTEREAQQATRPHASGVHILHPLRGTEDDQPELTSAQRAWLDAKATDPDCLEVGPCRFLPGGTLLVECVGLFDRTTFVVDQEGNEL